MMCMKRIAAIVLIMAVFCSLAGCGTDTVATEAETTEAGSEPETSTIETTGAEETTTEPTQTEETVTEPSETETATEAATDPEEQSIQAAVPAETEAETEAPHVCSYVAQVIEPTCTEQGYTLYTCPVCGNSYTDNWTPALGHDYVDTVVPATVDAGGYTEHVCSRCGYSYRDNETPKLVSTRWDDPDVVWAIVNEMNDYIKSLGYDNDPNYCGTWAATYATSAEGTSPEHLRSYLIEGIQSNQKNGIYDMFVSCEYISADIGFEIIIKDV